MSKEQIELGNEDAILAYEVADEALERAAEVEKLGAATLAFCSGLDTCPA